MERRALAAIVLSVLVIFGYQWYAGKNAPPQPLKPSGAMESQVVPRDTISRTRETTFPVSSIQPSPLPSVEEKETLVETERFIITFTNIGGSIKKIELKDYPGTETNKPLEIILSENPGQNIASVSGIYFIPNSASAGYNLTREGDTINYTYNTGDFAIEKRFKVYNPLNHIELWVTIQNNLDREYRAEYKIIDASGIDRSGAFAARYIEANSKVSGKILRDKKDSTHQGEVSWVALKNKYFALILKPYQFAAQSFVERIGKDNLLAGIETAQFIIPAHSEVNHQYLYYIGPIDTNTLKEYGLGLEEVVDYGMFGGISIFLLGILRFFHKLLHSWGLSIILVTILINIAFLIKT